MGVSFGHFGVLGGGQGVLGLHQFFFNVYTHICNDHLI